MRKESERPAATNECRTFSVSRHQPHVSPRFWTVSQVFNAAK